MSIKLLRAVTLAAGLLVPVSTLVSTTGTAHAQGTDADKVAAKKAYKKGTIKYNLGEWEQAIVQFKAAFEAYPDASFLFNIAQSYRQADNCKQSAFFYKRYLAIKPDASNRREVEGFIKNLNAECEKRKSMATTPPPPPPDNGNNGNSGNTTDAGGGNNGGTSDGGTTGGNTNSDGNMGVLGDGTRVADSGATGSGSTDTEVTNDPSGGSVSTGSEAPSLLMAYASVGSSFMSMGDLETSPQLNFTLGGGYPLHLGSITLDAGVLISHTSVEWDAVSASGRAGFTALLLNVGAGKEIANKIRVRGELGAGVMVYSGLDVIGNIFVDQGTMATGALSSASFRLALGAEYAITDNIAVSVQPVVLNSSPAPEGMRAGIDNVNSFQALAGVAYKM